MTPNIETALRKTGNPAEMNTMQIGDVNPKIWQEVASAPTISTRDKGDADANVMVMSFNNVEPSDWVGCRNTVVSVEMSRISLAISTTTLISEPRRVDLGFKRTFLQAASELRAFQLGKSPFDDHGFVLGEYVSNRIGKGHGRCPIQWM